MPLSRIKTTSLEDNAVNGRRNLIINGAMQVAQRGTSETTSNKYLIDRFKTDFSGGALTTEQVSLTSSDTPYATGFRKALKLSNTTAGSTAASDFRRIQYFVEAQDVVSSGWEYTSSSSYVTFSFWVKSSVAGTYVGTLQSNDGTAQNYTFEYTVAADTWTKVTHTAPGDSDITVNNDNGQGLRLYWWPHLGTNFTTSGHTNEAWADYSSSSQGKDYAQNWASTLNATFFVTGVQLEVGEHATPFEHRSISEELQLCQRYFFNPFAGGNGQSAQITGFFPVNFGTIVSTGNNGHMVFHVPFPVSMRAAPSLSHDLSNDDLVSASPSGSQVSFYYQNQGWTTKAGNGNLNTLSRNVSTNAGCLVGTYYISPGGVRYDQVAIGASNKFHFSAEL